VGAQPIVQHLVNFIRLALFDSAKCWRDGSGSRQDFRRFAVCDETLGEFRYAKRNRRGYSDIDILVMRSGRRGFAVSIPQ
jgi:hypothetical protein